MNDLKQIRDLMPEHAPPSPNVVAQARARLVELTDLPPARTRSAFPRRRLVAVAAAVTVVAGAAAGVATLTPSQPETPAGTAQLQPGARALSAREVLLVAAQQADDATKPTGRFWRLRTVTGFAAITVGTAPDTYKLEQRTVSEYWTARDAADQDWSGGRTLGSRPATPADEQAWRAAGSPTTWDLGADPELNGRHHVLSAAPDAGFVVPLRPDERRSEADLTIEELRALPTDPAALGTELLKHKPAGLDLSDQGWLFSSTVDLLAGAPVSPGVRAAAFRLIADLGGVTSTGTATDPLGRTGTGVTFVERGKGNTFTVTDLIIDAKSGQLLSATRTAKAAERTVKQAYTAVLSAGWTTDAPSIPSADVP